MLSILRGEHPQAQGDPCFPRGDRGNDWPAKLILQISATAPSPGVCLKAFYSSTAPRTPVYGAERFIDRSGEMNSFPLPLQTTATSTPSPDAPLLHTRLECVCTTPSSASPLGSAPSPAQHCLTTHPSGREIAACEAASL